MGERSDRSDPDVVPRLAFGVGDALVGATSDIDESVRDAFARGEVCVHRKVNLDARDVRVDERYL